MVSTRASTRLEGHVYILTSPICEYIKIGGTNKAPLGRIKEINACDPYKRLGPWSLHDFRQVADWRKVESSLHYTFRSKLARSVDRQKELFAVSPVRASRHLEQIDQSLLLKKPQVDRLFQDEEFSTFLVRLFRSTALLNWLDLQGAWTLSLFPATGSGRYYTINIGSHEVAFATIPSNDEPPIHMIHMDRLVHDFKKVSSWVRNRDGCLDDDNYKTGMYRSTSVVFRGNFDTAMEFLGQDGIRRAIIAYWTEALIGLQERGNASRYSRYHNWNAVAELKRKISSELL